MAKQSNVFSRAKFLGRINALAIRMGNEDCADYMAYAELRDLLEKFDDTEQVTNALDSALWLVRQFIFAKLENNFGKNSRGYPVESKVLMDQVIKNLGMYITVTMAGSNDYTLYFFTAARTCHNVILECAHSMASMTEEWLKL